METFKRVFAISLLVVLSVITALLLGAGVAIWDMGETVSTVYAMTIDEADSQTVVKDKQTIVVGEKKLSDVETITIEGPKKESGKLDANIDIPEQFKSDEMLKDNQSTEEDENSEELTEEDETLVEDIPEKEEPIVLTSEIAGLTEITRATEDGAALISNMAGNAVSSGMGGPSMLQPGEYKDPQSDYPREYTEVDMSYFDDALFIGDSRMQGLGMYSKSGATFYAATAFQLFQYVTFKVVPTANGKVPIFDAMQYDQFTKVYIKVGLNELGCVSEEKFLDVYQEFVDKIRAMQPRAIIYIHAVLPVTASKSQTDHTHNNEKISARNERLKAFAQMNKCYYIDASEPFVDETGALLANSTADGIHMAGRYMQDWIEYLRKHAVQWP